MNRALNLYAGVGGNRKNWSGLHVTAVEIEPKIAGIYQRLHPADDVVIGDAHQYLIEHYQEFDFIWSSPPCQTHSKMARATRHKLKRYPDMSLYQQIIFLQTYAKVPWVVENVVPYYTPLIPPTKRIGRHLFWSNFDFDAEEIPTPRNFINRCNVSGKRALQDWLGIHYEENIYYGSNHCPAQILRNCVHPSVGAQILACAPLDRNELLIATHGMEAQSSDAGRSPIEYLQFVEVEEGHALVYKSSEFFASIALRDSEEPDDEHGCFVLSTDAGVRK